MNHLIPILAFTAEQAPVAEKLLDFIYQLNDRQTRKGTILLVANHDVHDEFASKLAIAAELAFENVDLIQAHESNAANPNEIQNQMFRFAGEHFIRHYRCPFFWLEPNCVPLKPEWLDRLLLSYNAQPKRYMGSHLQFVVATEKAPAKFALGRCSVYPPDAINDLLPFLGTGTAFNLSSSAYIFSRSTKSRLVQEGSFDGDMTKLREDAVLLCADKTGKLIEELRKNMPVSGAEKIIAAFDGGQVQENVTIVTQPPKPKMTPAERMAIARAARKNVGRAEMAKL